MEGLFITFEGTEGSGKSTQIKLLAERLASLQREVLTLREPGGTPLGEQIRDLLKHSPASATISPETELLLMNASRAQLVREVIQPALCRKAIVLCDRFYDSTIAYQVYGRGLDVIHAERVIELAVGGTIPHLTLLLRVPLEVSLKRRRQREDFSNTEPDRFERADQSFFERVEQGYNAIAESGGARVRTIDATLPIHEVQAEIWRWVEALVATPVAPGTREYKSVGEYREEGPE